MLSSVHQENPVIYVCFLYEVYSGKELKDYLCLFDYQQEEIKVPEIEIIGNGCSYILIRLKDKLQGRGLDYFLNSSFRKKCLFMSLLSCRVVIPASSAVSFILPEFLERTSLRYFFSVSSIAFFLA